MRAFPIRLVRAVGIATRSLVPSRVSWAFRLAAAELFGLRSFDAAQMHRLYADWIASCRPPDEEIRGDVKVLRARARELARNNAYIARYNRLLQNNVVGPMGIRLQAQVKNRDGDLNNVVNDAIEAAWNDWASHPVTVDGRHNLRQFEKLIERTWSTDGEIFIRLFVAFDGNKYGIALQAIDADLIDITYNRAAGGGKNEIRMGVEVDGLGRPVGYWVWTMKTTSGYQIMGERYFVPADQIVHLYYADRPNQTRGVTRLHAAMAPAHMLNAYEESEAIASRVASSKMGFVETASDGFGQPVQDTKGKKQMTMEASPGTIERLAVGESFKQWDPEHPTGQFPAFVKQMLRKISSAVSVFYNVLANDAEQVTYSTMRSFALIDRDDWKALQQDLIEMWRMRLYEAWLKMALLTGALSLPTMDFRHYLAVRHRARGWPWIDPEKEVKAAVLAIENGLGTRTGFLADKGEDFEETLQDLAREQKLAAEFGVDISGGDAGDEEKLTKEEWEALQDEDGGDGGGNGDGRELPDERMTPPSRSSRPRHQSFPTT